MMMNKYVPTSPEEWRQYWQVKGFPWRTEPEIDVSRQEELSQHRTTVPDIKKGIYPFKGMKLSRADVEWLLATHENGRGPVNWNDVSQRERKGLDLRGADLNGGLCLQGLPLSRLHGGFLPLEVPDTKGVLNHTKQAKARRVAMVDPLGPRESPERAMARKAEEEQAAILLKRADLSGAHLEGAMLTKAHLDDARLSRAYLERANLREAHLEGADLRGAQLEGADLRGAHLEGVAFMMAHLEGADLSEAHLEGDDFWATYLENANLKGAHLEGAHLRGMNLERANLKGAHLEGANLSGANLKGADLSGARLERADLSGARLERADLSDAFLERADLKGAHLEGANLRYAQLQGADLFEVQLQGAELFEARLQGAKLFEARLQGADLRSALFDNATDLHGVILGDDKDGVASLADVKWGGVNLAVVDWSSLKMLGDEYMALQPTDSNGMKKDRASLLGGYNDAARANRQLALALYEQGLNQEADKFAYRAQVLQRKVFWMQREIGRWLFSLMLALLAGYGYRMWRILVAYLIIVLLCAVAYFVLGIYYEPHLSILEAVLTSITAFHGRVFSEPFLQPGEPQLWVTTLEAVAGLVIEGVFIAMLTQKFFGK